MGHLRVFVSLLLTCVLGVGVLSGAHVWAWSDAAPAPLQTTPSDEAQTLALERAVNEIRLSYRQAERAPSGKLRSVARFWAVVYESVAVDVEGTKLAGLLFETLKVSDFNPALAPYYAVYDEPGLHSPDEIAETWRAAIYRYWIFEIPNYAFQGCHYRSAEGKTQAFCILADALPIEPPSTATPTPAPLGRPPMATSRPLITPTRTPLPPWWRP